LVFAIKCVVDKIKEKKASQCQGVEDEPVQDIPLSTGSY
jgi:hypothetical protein